MANERIEHDANQAEHSLGHQHDGKAAQPWEIPAPGGRQDTTAPLGPASPLISADAAAKALQEYFLANADRGDDAANDELVAELLRRIRARQASAPEGGC